MNPAQPPSLPYIRDEASTSQHLAAYPAYTPSGGSIIQHADSYVLTSSADTATSDEFYDDELLDEEHQQGGQENGEGGQADGNAPQYWAGKRHMAGRLADKGEDEYGAQPAAASEQEADCSGLETQVSDEDVQCGHVHLLELRSRPARCRQDESLRKA